MVASESLVLGRHWSEAEKSGSCFCSKGTYPTLQTVWVPLCCLKPPLTTTAEQHNKLRWNIYLLHFISTPKLYWKVSVLIQIISEKSFRPSFRRSPSAPCGAYQAPIQYIHHWISLPYQSWGWIEYPIYLRDGFQSYSAEWKRAPISYFSSGLRCLGPLASQVPCGFNFSMMLFIFSESWTTDKLLHKYVVGSVLGKLSFLSLTIFSQILKSTWVCKTFYLFSRSLTECFLNVWRGAKECANLIVCFLKPLLDIFWPCSVSRTEFEHLL